MEVVRGVDFMWRDVRRGFGWVDVGDMWKRERVEEGPEVRRRGDEGWKERHVTADY